MSGDVRSFDTRSIVTTAIPGESREAQIAILGFVLAPVAYIAAVIAGSPTAEVGTLVETVQHPAWAWQWTLSTLAVLALTVGATVVFRETHANGATLTSLFGAGFAWLAAGLWLVQYVVALPVARAVVGTPYGQAQLSVGQTAVALRMIEGVVESLHLLGLLVLGISVLLLGLALHRTRILHDMVAAGAVVVGLFDVGLGVGFLATQSIELTPWARFAYLFTVMLVLVVGLALYHDGFDPRTARQGALG